MAKEWKVSRLTLSILFIKESVKVQKWCLPWFFERQLLVLLFIESGFISAVELWLFMIGKIAFAIAICIYVMFSANRILLPKSFWPTMRKNRSSDWEKLEITRSIYSNSERSEQFLVTECFFNLFLEVFIPNKLEQLEFILEKIIGIQKHAGKVRKNNIFLMQLCQVKLN